MFSMSTLLFVGCSFTDADIFNPALFDPLNLDWSLHSHYALLPLEPGQSEANARAVFRREHGVTPIYYEPARTGDRHENLVSLLADIASAPP
jgi:hypothetical protein